MNKIKKNDSAIPQLEEKLVRELVSEGREKGFVTIDEINENLGDETPSAEQLEKIFEIFTLNFQIILIYFWVLKRPDIMANGHIFLAGLINDVVMGFPLGISSLSY